MTIASEITKLNTNLTNAYTAVDGKGGTLPQAQNFDNLATAISSIPSGSSPTLITKSITVNGTYNASSDNADGYSSVTVNVSGGGGGIGITREVKNGVYQMPTTSFTFSLPNDATDVGNNGLYYAFKYCTGLTSVDLSSLTKVSGSDGLNSAFYGCTGLTSVDLSSLTSVGKYGLNSAFYGCKALTSVDLSALTSVDNNGLSTAFYNCIWLTSVDLSSLTSVGSYGLNNAFNSCQALTSVDLSSLTSVDNNGLYYAFNYCTGLTDIYFRALTTSSFGSNTNQFNNMMSNTGSRVTHTLHFPSNLESTISGLTGYPLFGGTSGKVVCAFDLPATS